MLHHLERLSFRLPGKAPRLRLGAKMSRLKCLAATCILALTVGAANANTITTFDVTGTFAYPTSLSLSGTLTVDVTVGTVIAADVVATGYPDFTILFSSDPVLPSRWVVILRDVIGDNLRFAFFTNPNAASLVSFTGGLINFGCLWTLACITGLESGTFSILSGSLNPEVTATPLPGALTCFTAADLVWSLCLRGAGSERLRL